MRINYFLFLFLSGLLLFQSCSVEKRHYIKGYYVHPKSVSVKKIPAHSANSREVSIDQIKENIAAAGLKKEEEANLISASSVKKQPLVLPYKPIVLPAPGDTCDTLVLRDGTEIKSRVMEISSSLIRYKHCDNPDGPTYNVPLNNVAMVKYKNGSKEEFKIETVKEMMGSGPGGSHITVTNYAPSRMTDEDIIRKKAKLAMVFGIISIPTLILYFAGIVFAIMAINYGQTVLRMMKNNPNLADKDLKTKASTGIITGIISLMLVVLLIALLVALATGVFI